MIGERTAHWSRENFEIWCFSQTHKLIVVMKCDCFISQQFCPLNIITDYYIRIVNKAPLFYSNNLFWESNKVKHKMYFCVLFCSLVKRLEFGPAPPRGISQGSQSPQGGVKILLWEEANARTSPIVLKLNGASSLRCTCLKQKAAPLT